MTINWQQEAEKLEPQLLSDLTTLLKINSERDTDHQTDEYPLGPGPAKALEAFLAIAQRDGFKTLNVDHVAGRIELGDGDEIFGLLAMLMSCPRDQAGKPIHLTPLFAMARFMAAEQAMTKAQVSLLTMP